MKSITTGRSLIARACVDHVLDVFLTLATQSDAAQRLGQLHEVRDAARVGGQVGLRVALLVEQRLPLAHHAQVAVVDQRHLDRHAFDRAGGQFLVGHLEATVAVDRPHLRVRAGHLGAHGGRDGEPHGAQPAGVEPGARLLVGDELRRPHLVLADAGDVHGVRAGDLTQLLDDVFGAEAAVALRIVAQRIGGPHVCQVGPPLGHVDLAGHAVVPQHLDQLGDDGLDVADDRHVGMAVLADLGRVDIGVDDLGLRREGVELPGHPVVEAGAQRDQQVAALQGRHRGDGAVHAGHAQVLTMAVRERTARHQRGHHRDAGRARPARAAARSPPRG